MSIDRAALRAACDRIVPGIAMAADVALLLAAARELLDQPEREAASDEVVHRELVPRGWGASEEMVFAWREAEKFHGIKGGDHAD